MSTNRCGVRVIPYTLRGHWLAFVYIVAANKVKVKETEANAGKKKKENRNKTKKKLPKSLHARMCINIFDIVPSLVYEKFEYVFFTYWIKDNGYKCRQNKYGYEKHPPAVCVPHETFVWRHGNIIWNNSFGEKRKKNIPSYRTLF